MTDWIDRRDWYGEYINNRPYPMYGYAPLDASDVELSREEPSGNHLLADRGFNNHDLNDGTHVSPYDEGKGLVGVDGLIVKLIQPADETAFKRLLSRTLRATTGIHPDAPDIEDDWEEMMKGGLQSALESQVIAFEVHGASRALTHQLVRSRKAAFHQQSQRATWFGLRPNFRIPESIVAGAQNNWDLLEQWKTAAVRCWEAYTAACEAGVSYQDARYILPEGTVNYIVCEYSIREFINFFSYRGCSGFLWEMVHCAREMRRVLLEANPFLAPYVKITCEKPTGKCPDCDGTGKFGRDGTVSCNTCKGSGNAHKCTFQGWENVEGFCDFPWAKQANRTFLPNPKLRIGA